MLTPSFCVIPRVLRAVMLCRLHSSGNHQESSGVGRDSSSLTQHEIQSGLPDVMPVSTHMCTLSPKAIGAACLNEVTQWAPPHPQNAPKDWITLAQPDT